MAVTVFGYLILIRIDFDDFSISSLVLVSTEKIYQKLRTMFDHISKHLEVCQKYFATRRIFDFRLSIWKCGKTRSLVFDILHPQQDDHIRRPTARYFSKFFFLSFFFVSLF